MRKAPIVFAAMMLCCLAFSRPAVCINRDMANYDDVVKEMVKEYSDTYAAGYEKLRGGDTYGALKDFESCLENLDFFYKEVPDETRVPVFLDLGGVHYRRWEFREAIPYLEKALDVIGTMPADKKPEYTEIKSARESLAGSYFMTGEYEKSARAYDAIVAELVTPGLSGESALGDIALLARVYYKSGDATGASREIEKARSIMSAGGIDGAIVEFYTLLFDLLEAAMIRKDTATDILGILESISKNDSSFLFVTPALADAIAETTLDALAARRDADSIIRGGALTTSFLNLLRANNADYDFVPVSLNNYSRVTGLYFQTMNAPFAPENARAWNALSITDLFYGLTTLSFQKGLDLDESIRTRLNDSYTCLLVLAYFDTLSNPQSKWPARALGAFESGMNRATLAKIKDTALQTPRKDATGKFAAYYDLKLAYDEKLLSLRAEFDSSQSGLTAFFDAGLGLAYLKRLDLRDARKELDAVFGCFEQNSVAQDVFEPFKPAEIIHEGEDALYFILINNHLLFRIHIRENKVTFLPLQSRHDIGFLVKSWRNNQDADVAKKLYAALVGDDVESLLARNVVVIPTGVLYGMPFEALIDGEGRYWVESHNIHYIPSLMMLKSLRAGCVPVPASWGHPFFGMGDAIFSSADPRWTNRQDNAGCGAEASREVADTTQLTAAWRDVRGNYTIPRICNSGLEVDAIGKFFYKYNGLHVLRGGKASETNYYRMPLDSYRYLHIATHGMLDSYQGWKPRLILSLKDDGGNDGFLDTSEIISRPLSAELVVLSACQSGLGPVSAGEGIDGFSLSFFVAGAQGILVSLWSVSDKYTADFMIDFYKALTANPDDINENLENIKRNWIAQNQNPLFWAPFVYIGK